MKEFFLELFSEEIPAKMQHSACVELEEQFKNKLGDSVGYSNLKTFVTPRRLVLVCDVEEYTKPVSTEYRGPNASASDEVLARFAESKHATTTECYKKVLNGKEYWFITVITQQELFESKIEALVENIIREFKWPKSMSWNSSKIRWIRPLRNVFACFSGHPVPLNIAGVGNSFELSGHRVLGTTFSASSFDEYSKKLAEQYVILDFQTRKDEILKQIHKIQSEHDLSVHIDTDLLDEITGLIEYPTVILGKIPERFLSLPQEVITNCMAHHQKFLSVFKGPELAPFFISVCNIADTSNFIHGCQKVLNARLSDAEFFFLNDRKRTLESRVQDLSGSEFYAKLGSMLDKTERVRFVTSLLCSSFNIDNNLADRAALLSKCDLNTEMVYEFPELQGIMGGIYASLDGENVEVSTAIREQYSPTSPQDPVPASKYGAALSLADKLDSLCSFFSLGVKLHGSKDPMGLRRAGIGIIRILLDHNIQINLRSIISQICDRFGYQDVLVYFTQFIIDRLVQLVGCQQNLANAILNREEGLDIVEIASKIDVLKEYAYNPEIIAAYKRLSNTVSSPGPTNVEPELFQTDHERKFYNIILSLQHLDDTKEFMSALAQNANEVNTFLDSVHINVEDESIKNNRLALVAFAINTFDKYIKFTLLF